LQPSLPHDPRLPSLARLLLLTSVVGIGVTALYTALRGSPGWLWVIALALATGGVASLGVYFPWLEMFARVVCRGPRGSARLALTFDDGPHPETTRRVLAALASTRHRATFFVLGEKVERHPDVVREIRDAGHSLAVHGFVHDRLHPFRSSLCIQRELVRALDAIESASGIRPIWFRPPVGQTSPSSVLGARRAGVRLMGWSGRAYDGVRWRTPESALKSALRSSVAGAIVVMHDAAEHDDFVPASLAILPSLLAELDARGLTSVGVDTLFETSPVRA
jgi:peptidoglycan/xylan/chitin deacetylase (PgdA/CDA1 family)